MTKLNCGSNLITIVASSNLACLITVTSLLLFSLTFIAVLDCQKVSLFSVHLAKIHDQLIPHPTAIEQLVLGSDLHRQLLVLVLQVMTLRKTVTVQHTKTGPTSWLILHQQRNHELLLLFRLLRFHLVL